MDLGVQRIHERIDETIANLRRSKSLAGELARAACAIAGSLRAGGAVYLFGNGGSAADAQHIAGELVGRFLKERAGYRAEALSTDASVMTAIANDYDFEGVFARQIAAKGRPGDVAVALTTSGRSPNIAAGLREAANRNMVRIVLTSGDGGRCAELADVLLNVSASNSPRIQEIHAVFYHVLCELIEEELTT